MGTRRWMYVLLGAVAVDIAWPFIVTGGEALAGAGDRVPSDLDAVITWTSDVVVVVAVLVVCRYVLLSQREMFHSTQVMRATASTTSDWLWETDTKNRFTYCSPGVEHLLGYQPEALIGVDAKDLLAGEENLSEFEDGCSHLIATKSSWDDLEVAWRHQAGHTVVLRGSAAPILDEAGHIVGHRGTRRFVANDVDAVETSNAVRRVLSLAIVAEAVDIALQPIVSLVSGHLVGVEALARFRDGRGPDLWFREARETGQTLYLDRLTFLAALERFGELPDTTYLSINASPDLILDARFRDELFARQPSMDRIVIEVTEHERVSDYRALNRALATMRQRGARVAVDDAGAGYASLTHVLELRPDIIKLDRELLTDLHIDRARRSLVTSLVLLALDIGASVTGEGVETVAQLETLATLGVDHGQGFLLARPSTGSEAWLRDTNFHWPQATFDTVTSLQE